MNGQLDFVNTEPLRPAPSAHHYQLHKAALEWSLADPIIINSREDIQSRANWEGRVDPYHHQVQNLITFCRRLPVTLLADDVGLGKTISAGLILSELLVRKRIRRALVICPKILMPQWVEELESKFAIEARAATGQDLDAEVKRRTPVVVTTYDSARTRIHSVPDNDFSMLILDEAHKLRNLYGGAGNPPVMASNIRSVLEKQAFKYVLMLTATPLQNRIWDLYSLVDCMTVGRGKNPFGTPSQFSANFIADASKGARRIKPGREQEFRRILSQYIARTRRGDAKLLFPERKVLPAEVVPTDGELQLMRLLGSFIQGLNHLVQTSLAQALFSSPDAFLSQLTNMSSKGTVHPKYVEVAKTIISAIPAPAKLNGLMSIVEQLKRSKPNDWRLVIFTTRRETQESLGRFFSSRNISFGFIRGGDPRANQQTITDFKKEIPAVNVIVSTDAGAEGVNLQIANVLVNYDLPWNPMVVEQRIGRIQRLGGQYKTVNVVNLVAKGTVEEHVVGRLMEKLQLAAHAIGDIEAILESVGGEDNEEGLEDKIREMVVQSLVGQDVAKAARMAEESILQAHKEIEEQRQEIDERLGQLDALHSAGPKSPKLSKFKPSRPLQEFVLDALKADGYSISPDRNGIFQAVPSSGAKSLFAFDDAALEQAPPGAFGGNAPRLYKQGSAAFERLAQSWCEKNSHHIVDLTKPDTSQLRHVAEEWAKGIGSLSVLDAVLESTEPAFQGSVLLRTKSVVSVDSYEKLIEIQRQGKYGFDESRLPSDAPVLRRELSPKEIANQIADSALNTVRSDSDLIEFERFYEARRAEELQRALGDARLEKKCTDDFTPRSFVDIVGAKGVSYSVARIKVTFSVNSEGEYSDTIEAVPITGQLVSSPAINTCAHTNARAPESCFQACAVSGKRTLSHLLQKSSVSDRAALPEYVVVCDVTGKCALQDEMAKSDVSGKTVVSALLSTSALSGKRALSEEMGVCDFTNSRVLLSELAESQVSHKRYRIDEGKCGGLANLKGHQSEFVQCQFSQLWYLPTECKKSGFSGKLAFASHLTPSEKSGRLGLPDELGSCQVSNKTLLVDELKPSAVSGRRVDIDLLVKSARSNQWALPDELVTCQESGVKVLLAETDRCAISGKTVDRTLLLQSSLSGKWALGHLMVYCPRTRARALPDELKECQVSKTKVAPSILGQCSISGVIACKEYLVRSDFSNDYVLKEHAVKSIITGRVCSKREAVVCAWQQGPVLPSEAAMCTFTGLTFGRNLLNQQGELIILRDLLDGKVAGSDIPGFIKLLAPLKLTFLSGASEAQCRMSPNQQMIAVCAKKTSWFGLKSEHTGFVLFNDERGMRAAGKFVRGTRTAGHFSIQD